MNTCKKSKRVLKPLKSMYYSKMTEQMTLFTSIYLKKPKRAWSRSRNTLPLYKTLMNCLKKLKKFHWYSIFNDSPLSIITLKSILTFVQMNLKSILRVLPSLAWIYLSIIQLEWKAILSLGFAASTNLHKLKSLCNYFRKSLQYHIKLAPP